MATTINDVAADPTHDGAMPTDDLSRWLQQAFLAARAPQPARLPTFVVHEADPPRALRGTSAPAARNGAPCSTARAARAPTVRPTYMLLLTLSLATLLLTAL